MPNTELRVALKALATTYAWARFLERSVWDFAVERQVLEELGCSDDVLTWLVEQGYAEHRLETRPPPAGKRAFRLPARAGLRSSSCFVLTEAGAAYLPKIRLSLPRHSRLRPSYNPSSRALMVGYLALKRFRQQAPDQELVLLSFEELKWTASIDDPLPRLPGRNPKRHLHQTIDNLNRHQRLPLLHFFGDGTGTRIGWRWKR